MKVETLLEFCVQAMLKCGMRKKEARIAAEVLVTTDAWGVYSHGTRALRQYLKRMRAGGLKAQARPHIIHEGPAFAMLDADNALAMVSACRAMEIAIAKAKTAGIGYVTVKNSCHFGAAGYYANLAVQKNMIGMAMSNVDTNVVAPSSKKPVIGCNPLAYAVPAGKEKPVFLDIAMSTVAAGKIAAAKFAGKSIPNNWFVDDEGLPTTDPSLYPEHGALQPMAGHKGFGLAILIEVLSAVLAGAAVTKQLKSWGLEDPANPTGHGHAFLAIDIAALMPMDVFQERMDQMIREIRNAPKAKGADRIYLPGEIEWQRYEEQKQKGLSLPPEVIDSLYGLADDLELERLF